MIDCRSVFKSYNCAYKVIQELRHRKLRHHDVESVVKLVMRNNKGMLHDISVWCEATSNELLGSEPGGKGDVGRLAVYS